MANDSVNYTNAPIEEALIEIRVSYKSSYEDSISQFQKQMADFPKCEKIPQTRFRFKVADNKKPKVEDVPIEQYAYRFVSEDKKFVVQITDIGLVVSQLKPYEGWTTFESKILECANKFFQSFSIDKVIRVGLRTINKLSTTPDEFYSYFNSYPSLAYGDFALEANTSTMQFQVFNREKDLHGIITQVITPKQENETLNLNVTFDIDVFKNMSILPTSDGVKKFLPDMRAMKNDIFEANITQTLRDKIGE